MKKQAHSAVLWLWMAALMPVATATAEFETVYKLPASIEQVDTLCPWKSAQDEGYIRLVRSQHQGQHRLFIQWIRKGIGSQPDETVSTRVVEELDRQYAVRLDAPLPRLHPDHCEINMGATAVENERRYRLQLRLKGPGEYRLRAIEMLQGDQ